MEIPPKFQEPQDFNKVLPFKKGTLWSKIVSSYLVQEN
jgi:hypothetical protein